MSTYRELVYLCNDELKLSSDDSTITLDHIIFLLSKYRAFILKLRYSDVKKLIPESNYLTVCLGLIEVPAISGEACEGGVYLRSKNKLPITMKIGTPRVYPIDYYQGEITYVTRDRMRYIGYNKYLLNIIYCSIAPDGYLYFKSSNPLFLHLENVRFTAIFEDPTKVSEFLCSEEEIPCDILDREFPIEEGLTLGIVELVVKELKNAEYTPEDNDNNANDDISDLANFIRRNMKSNMLKLLES